jgi:hypothetical protein
LENLALLCPHCNLHKAAKLDGCDPVSGLHVELFHPVKSAWDEHFMLLDDGYCRGISPVGRATIEALQMNDELAVAARLLQVKTGILAPTQHQRN